MKFEDIQENEMYFTNSHMITKDEIKNFGSQFDPIYIHVDERKAKESIFGELIASGLHTLGITWKLWIDLDIMGEDAIGGVGIDNVRFIKPVFPNDELYVEAQIVNKKEHPKQKKRGYFTIRLKTYNQDKELVLKADVTGLVKRK